MRVTIDQTGHGWTYSHAKGVWLRVVCSCNETAQRCPEPNTKPRGTVTGKVRKATYQEIGRFEEAFMSCK